MQCWNAQCSGVFLEWFIDFYSFYNTFYSTVHFIVHVCHLFSPHFSPVSYLFSPHIYYLSFRHGYGCAWLRSREISEFRWVVHILLQSSRHCRVDDTADTGGRRRWGKDKNKIINCIGLFIWSLNCFYIIILFIYIYLLIYLYQFIFSIYFPSFHFLFFRIYGGASLRAGHSTRWEK